MKRLAKMFLVVAILAVGGLCLVPWFLRSRISDHETATVGALRELSISQEEFKSARLRNLDGDQAGEYGYFQDLAEAGLFRPEFGEGARDCSVQFRELTEKLSK